ncbi:hypothetical protein P3G55_11055 [Leptospira sp. 96542]|nr:hypothetical protein [Leptospira sp. 96542]
MCAKDNFVCSKNGVCMGRGMCGKKKIIENLPENINEISSIEESFLKEEIRN